MAETYCICKNSSGSATTIKGSSLPIPTIRNDRSHRVGGIGSILEEYICTNGGTTNECRIAIPKDKNDQDVIHDLKRMPRRDLIQLFLYCDVPHDLNEISGDWDGILLDNNSILVSTTAY
jgi:hypothetical protein